MDETSPVELAPVVETPEVIETPETVEEVETEAAPTDDPVLDTYHTSDGAPVEDSYLVQ